MISKIFKAYIFDQTFVLMELFFLFHLASTLQVSFSVFPGRSRVRTRATSEKMKESGKVCRPVGTKPCIS